MQNRLSTSLRKLGVQYQFFG